MTDEAAKIIQLVTTHYIDEKEAEIEKLKAKIKTDKSKNRDVKGYASDLARDLLQAHPGHPLAEKVLALLLEDELRLGDPPRRGKKT